MKHYTDEDTGKTFAILRTQERGRLARLKSAILTALSDFGAVFNAGGKDALSVAAEVVGDVLATNGKKPDDGPEYEGKTDDPLGSK